MYILRCEFMSLLLSGVLYQERYLYVYVHHIQYDLKSYTLIHSINNFQFFEG